MWYPEMETGCHLGISLVQKRIMSVTIRIDGRGGGRRPRVRILPREPTVAGPVDGVEGDARHRLRGHIARRRRLERRPPLVSRGRRFASVLGHPSSMVRA